MTKNDFVLAMLLRLGKIQKYDQARIQVRFDADLSPTGNILTFSRPSELIWRHCCRVSDGVRLRMQAVFDNLDKDRNGSLDRGDITTTTASFPSCADFCLGTVGRCL